MAFFIPKEVVEKLKEAEKINNAAKDIEKAKLVAEKISKLYKYQMDMLDRSERYVVLEYRRVPHKEVLENYSEGLEALAKAQELALNISGQYETLSKAKEYSEMLHRALDELNKQVGVERNRYNSIQDITENYELFDNIKKASETFRVDEDASNFAEKSNSSKYLSNFLKKIKTSQ